MLNIILVGLEAFNQGIEWIQSLVDQFDIGDQSSQIGLIQYSTSVWSDLTIQGTVYGFPLSTNATLVNNNLANMGYAGGYTYTGQALR